MYYRIDSIDAWFFRNAAPFDAGVNTNGESIFPPFPSVYAGALRSCEEPIQNPNGGRNTFARRLKIGWNGVIADGRVIFPLPLDLYVSEKSDDHKLLAQEMILSPASGSSFPLDYFLKQSQRQGKPPHIDGGAYLDSSDMSAYLNGEQKDYSVRPLGNYFSKDIRIGIRIDTASGKAADGQMYQQTLVTPKKITPNGKNHSCNLALETSGIEVPRRSVVRLGGEGKLGVIECVEEMLLLPDAPDIQQSKYFKLYLATPAIFEKGWLPGWINPENKKGVFTYKKHGVRVKLLSAVVGKPIAVGGFGIDRDKKESRPREMRYAVPAGSVYFFELLDGKLADVIRLFHKRCISDYRETLGFRYETWNRLRYCSRGFGYSLIGVIDKNRGGKHS